jgi:hypothetical protein
MKAAMVARPKMKEKTMDKLITRNETERFDDQVLESKFADLQAILFRTQNAQGERLRALATLETLEAERNRRLARRPALAM